jgi:hypothetical protein
MKGHLVLNNAKTEGFFTTDQQVAYEVRKGADSNCFSADGERSNVGQAFCERWSHNEDCTKVQVLVVDEEALTTLNEMRDRTRRGIEQTAQEVQRQCAQLEVKVERNTPAQQAVREQRIKDRLEYLKGIHAYQHRVLRTLNAILTQEV